MNNEQFIAGEWVDCGSYKTFKPNKINHEFNLKYDNNILSSLQDAAYKLSTLNSLYKNDNLSSFNSILCLVESLCSGAIEGTYVTPQNVLMENSSSKHSQDGKKILALWCAIGHFETMENISFSSTEIFEEINSRVLPNDKKNDKSFGKIRKCQNFIGGFNPITARFIPPSPELVEPLLQDLCDFWNNNSLPFPDLIKIAIFHYQFETIHPFSDGNGRTGRIIINIQLKDKKLLDNPILCLSEFWSRNKELYFEALKAVQTSNKIEHWILFFLQSIIETCNKRIDAITDINKLRDQCKEKIENNGKNVSKCKDLLNYLFKSPHITISKVKDDLSLSYQVAKNLVQILLELKILKHSNENKRNQTFEFEEYINIIFNVVAEQIINNN